MSRVCMMRNERTAFAKRLPLGEGRKVHKVKKEEGRGILLSVDFIPPYLFRVPFTVWLILGYVLLTQSSISAQTLLTWVCAASSPNRGDELILVVKSY